MPVPCRLCSMTVPNYKCLSQHYVNIHTDKPEHRDLSLTAGKCEICIAKNPQNLHKLKQYLTPEALEKHRESHNTDATPTLKVKCVTCTKSFDYYSQLSEHYITEHQDNYRARYAGICDMCSAFSELSVRLPGLTPDKKYPTYEALKQHVRQVHWSGMTPEAKAGFENNTIGWTRGSM